MGWRFDQNDLNRVKDLIVIVLTAKPSPLFIPPGGTNSVLTDAYPKLVASSKS
jgi:hypothetical protein